MNRTGKPATACLWLLTVLRLASAAPAPSGLTEIFSHDGVLSATLVAQPGKIQVGDLELDAATYNGDYAGPVLHVHPGDVMRLRLVNRLSQPTNLHFHGFRSSPLGNGDNAHLVVQPNTSFDYEVRVPISQPIGLFWFHAHMHGFAETQIMGGLSGTILVESADPTAMRQRLFVLKDMVFDDDTGNDEVDDTLHGIVQSVNGQLIANETMRPGETQLWRFTNQSANLVKHIALSGHRLHIIAEDGEAMIDEKVVDVLDISPASRLDVLVEGGEPGRYALLAKNLMTGIGKAKTPDRIIGYLDVAGAAVIAPTGTSPLIPRSRPLPDLRASPVDARRDIVFSQKNTTKPEDQRFFVNGLLFEADRIDVRVPLGNIEEWTVRNDSDDTHVFHIHQIAYQVTEVNGTPVPFNGYVDTVLVPERGEVKLRMPFTDPLILGRFMFHCHVLRHEDKGMMANIEIYDPKPSISSRLVSMYTHVLWWWHGVPWSVCGLQDF